MNLKNIWSQYMKGARYHSKLFRWLHFWKRQLKKERLKKNKERKKMTEEHKCCDIFGDITLNKGIATIYHPKIKKDMGCVLIRTRWKGEIGLLNHSMNDGSMIILSTSEQDNSTVGYSIGKNRR